MDWEVNAYLRFAKERARPSLDLLHGIRLRGLSPKRILDLGCGSGLSTGLLADTFGAAYILGVDKSPSMLEKARATYENLDFRFCDLSNGLGELDGGTGKFDLIFSNACLHWIPNHGALIKDLASLLVKGGILAVQVPLIDKAIVHSISKNLASQAPWIDRLDRVEGLSSLGGEEYFDLLANSYEEVEIWESTYLDERDSYEEIIDWYASAGLRPYLSALENQEDALRQPGGKEAAPGVKEDAKGGAAKEFCLELLALLEASIPRRPSGRILLPIPRIFFIAKAF